MSQVTLTIGGRKHTLACDPGQEEHITTLAESIDAKLQQIGNPSAPDSQNMLFAALMLADELHDNKTTLSAALETSQSSDEGRDRTLNEAREAIAYKIDLEQTISDQKVELDKLRSERDTWASQTVSAPLTEDSDLASALERFADLLENCADKLEGKAGSA